MHAPEEINASGKSINNGGSPTVSDNRRYLIPKDKEYDYLYFMMTPFVSTDQRTDHNHACTVVPIQLESNVPISKSNTFNFGLPTRSPSRQIFPATQKRPNNKTINVI